MRLASQEMSEATALRLIDKWSKNIGEDEPLLSAYLQIIATEPLVAAQLMVAFQLMSEKAAEQVLIVRRESMN